MTVNFPHSNSIEDDLFKAKEIKYYKRNDVLKVDYSVTSVFETLSQCGTVKRN